MKLANQELYSAKAKSDILKLEVLREKEKTEIISILQKILTSPKNQSLSLSQKRVNNDIKEKFPFPKVSQEDQN